MRTVECDICGRKEELELDNGDIDRLFFNDICFNCYQEIKDQFINEKEMNNNA